MDVLKRLKDKVMGTDEQNKAAQKRMDERKAEKDREQTKKMRKPQSFDEKYALSTLRSQNKLAKEYEDIEKPTNMVEQYRKDSMPEKLRKTADRTFKNLPEEVKDYEAYKDAGFKKGGKVKEKATNSYKSGGSVSSASKRGDGCAQRGKTKGRMV